MEIGELETWFTAAVDASYAADQEAERARDYVNGKQLTQEEVNTLKKRGQPPVVINRIRRKIEWLKGLEVKQRTDPKAFPRTPEHQQGAEAATDAIRFVCDKEDWDAKRSQAYDDILVEGLGACEVVHKQNKRGEVDVKINHYPFDRTFVDPHSRRYDCSDARYKGVVMWMDEADFKGKFPKADVSQLFHEVASEKFDDAPRDQMVDHNRKRVRVVLMWYRKGDVWYYCQFVRGMKLDSGESPYVDDQGESVCPLIMMSAFIDRDNARYGIVRDMFDPQDEINKRRSRMLHNITAFKTVGVKGAVGSVAEMKRQLKQPDGHVEIERDVWEDATATGQKPFDIIPNSGQAQGDMALLEHATNEIDLLGANSALAGETGESTSGRAVLARQQGGMVEIASLLDKLHRFTREVFRHIWMRIKQYWTEEKWVRVTDDEDNLKFVGLNQPVTLADQLAQMPQEEAMMIARGMGLVPNDPRLGMVLSIENNVQELDVDIIIEEVPDRVSLEGEAFEALLRYAAAGQLPPSVLIEADPSLPAKKKEKLLEMMKQPQPNPAAQLDMAAQEAEIQKTQAEAAKISSEAQFPLAGLG